MNRSGFMSFYEFIFNPDRTISVNDYFPRDHFDSYSFFEIVKSRSSNEIFSFSNTESFTSSVYLNQKTIYSEINKSTFESSKLRYELCNNLLFSSLNNDAWKLKGIKTDQIRFILVYNEEHTFFTNTTYSFEYFFDVKNPKHGIYGGVNLDSLISQIRTHYIDSNNQELWAIAKRLNLSLGDLFNRADSTGSITFTREESELLSSAPLDIDGINNFYLHINSFNSVSPIAIRTLVFPKRPKHYIELQEDLYKSDKHYEAIAYRNVLTSKYQY